MRAGSDRFEAGEQVFRVMFPDAAQTLFGVKMSQSIEVLTTALGPATQPGNPVTWEIALEEGSANGRRVELQVHTSNQRIGAITARFFSKDRLDIDAGWRLIKEHMDRLHGAPAKEVGGVLAFVWRHSSDGLEVLTRGSRFKDQTLENVLQVESRPVSGGR